MKFLILVSLLFSDLAFASTHHCPSLKGEFFCKGVENSHKDMTMILREVRYAGKVFYEYTYEQEGEEAFSLDFVASDQGVKNFDQNDLVGRCINNSFFLSKDGKPSDKTLLNTINADGDYAVIRNKDQSPFLICNRKK